MELEDYFFDRYVTDDGLINSQGTIRLLPTECDESDDDNSTEFFGRKRNGIYLWNEQLLHFVGRNHKVTSESDAVNVLNADGVVVEKIPKYLFHFVEPSECMVNPDGYLEYCSLYNTEPEPYANYRVALKQAEQNELPSILEDSVFVKVDPSWAGQNLIWLAFVDEEDRALVYTKDGNPVPCVAGRPLAFKRWGVVPLHPDKVTKT